MRFLIHFELPDGTEDQVIVSGDTLAECEARANHEVRKRGGRDAWSEEVES